MEHVIPVGRTIFYQLPGDTEVYALKVSSARAQFAEVRQLLQKRQAPPHFYFAVEDPHNPYSYQEADFEDGLLPDWEPLKIKLKVPPKEPTPGASGKQQATAEDGAGQLRRIQGPWGPIWV